MVIVGESIGDFNDTAKQRPSILAPFLVSMYKCADEIVWCHSINGRIY